MKITYAPGLEQMAASLHHLGFEVHAMHENVAADAILFTESLQEATRSRVRKKGALLLNVRGLSPTETAEALRRRCQGTLF